MLFKDLREQTTCEVRDDPLTRCIYSVDASIYEIPPMGVAIPRNFSDLLSAVQIAYAHNVPVIARGAATGITGGCLGSGLIIDTSKYLNHIHEINIEQGYAVCEPGVVQDSLNQALSSFGYRLGPDTSTGNRATLGGMVANNSAGARSLRFGKMIDAVEEVEVILANGEVITFAPVDKELLAKKQLLNNFEGHIYRRMLHIADQYRAAIEAHFPRIPRMASGYNLDYFYHSPFNLAKIIVGSEGTLGIVSKVKVKIAPKPKATGLCVVHFHDIHEAMSTIQRMLSFKPIALEMIDHHILKIGAESPSIQSKLGWLQGEPKAVFVAEFDGDTTAEVESKLHAFQQEMQEQNIGYAYSIILDPQKLNHVWDVRKSGLGILLSKRSYSRAIAFIEDLSIPPEKLPHFMKEFRSYLQGLGKDAGIYGHVGSGCMHIRPFMDLRQPEEIVLMKKIMMDVADLTLKFGGVLSGEHGDGLIRSWLNPKVFGAEIYTAFKEVKQAFDPDNLMNPGKIVDGPAVDQNLRLSPQTPISKFPTYMDFTREGGFELSVDLCNGNGLCRKREGTMCPSFQATGDEYDSTRARAQALRGVIHGRLEVSDLTNSHVHDVLDLCLQCKGCKAECPSQVDMAKMKAEFLAHYQAKHGTPLRSRIFAGIGTLMQWGALFPHLFNKVNESRIVRHLLSKWGFAPQRLMPRLAEKRFSTLFKPFEQPETLKKEVVLLNDTFTEFEHPEIGIAAVKVLNALGYRVILPSWSCCGRPAISKGMLKKAKEQARKIVGTLLPYANQGLRIVGLEPSCILTLVDEYQDLIDRNWAAPVLKACCTFDEFVAQNKDAIVWKETPLAVKVHGHCHQKSLVGMEPTMKVLKSNPHIKVELIDSGCCGMAGSFGYEKEHYEISMKIGSLKLFPAIQASPSDAVLIASGTSCRTQILDGTGRKALHLAEFLASSMSIG